MLIDERKTSEMQNGKQATLFEAWARGENRSSSQRSRESADFGDPDDDDALLAMVLDKSLREHEEAEARKKRGKETEPRPGPSGICKSAQPAHSDCGQPEEILPGFDTYAGRTWIYPTNYPLREYQFTITQAALFQNTLVCLPTGLGKTFIAAVVMYNFYRWYPQGMIVFMAPTKPLVAQQIQACYNIMGIPQQHTCEMTGTMSPETRGTAWKTKRVFFLTPQVMLNDLTRGMCPAERVKCLVIDEAHKALGNHAYCQVVRELSNYTNQYRILALSATPGSDMKAVHQILVNIHISHVELRSEDSPDIQPYSHERIVEKVVVPLGEDLTLIRDTFHQVLRQYAQRLIKQSLVFTRDPTNLTKFQLLKAREAFRQAPPPQMPRNQFGIIEGDFAICMTLCHASELLLLHGLRPFYHFLKGVLDGEKGQGRTRTELLRNPSFLKMMEDLEGKFSSDRNVIRPGVFSQYRDSVHEITEMLSHYRPLVKAMSFVGHSGGAGGKGPKGFSQKEQMMVVKKFCEGGYNTLVSTCVGEEGLDIKEVDLIICYDAHKSPIRLVQRMGRTGRKRKGRIIMLVSKGKEEQVYNQGMCNKKSINKAIVHGGQKLQSYLYSSNPRMVPQGLNPSCHRMEMTVPEYEFQGKAGKQKMSPRNSRNIATMMAVANSRRMISQLQAYLNEEDLDHWSRNFKIPLKEYLSLDRSISNTYICRATGTSEAKKKSPSKRELRVDKYLPWQTTLQKRFLTGPSTTSKILTETLTFMDVLSTAGSETYMFEMLPYLDMDDVWTDPGKEVQVETEKQPRQANMQSSSVKQDSAILKLGKPSLEAVLDDVGDFEGDVHRDVFIVPSLPTQVCTFQEVKISGKEHQVNDLSSAIHAFIDHVSQFKVLIKSPPPLVDPNTMDGRDLLPPAIIDSILSCESQISSPVGRDAKYCVDDVFSPPVKSTSSMASPSPKFRSSRKGIVCSTPKVLHVTQMVLDKTSSALGIIQNASKNLSRFCLESDSLLGNTDLICDISSDTVPQNESPVLVIEKSDISEASVTNACQVAVSEVHSRSKRPVESSPKVDQMEGNDTNFSLVLEDSFCEDLLCVSPPKPESMLSVTQMIKIVNKSSNGIGSTISSNACIVRDPDARFNLVAGFLETSSDEEEEQELKDKLQQQNVGHDVGAPLNQGAKVAIIEPFKCSPISKVEDERLCKLSVKRCLALEESDDDSPVQRKKSCRVQRLQLESSRENSHLSEPGANDVEEEPNELDSDDWLWSDVKPGSEKVHRNSLVHQSGQHQQKPKKKSRIAQRKRKDREKGGRGFIEVEAEVSFDGSICISSDESGGSSYDEEDDTLINNNTQLSQDSMIDMQAVYLKSVRSPVGGVGKFKLHHYGKNKPKVMDSPWSCDEVASFTDEEDSFIVGNDEVEYLTDEGNDTLAIAEEGLKSKKRKRKVRRRVAIPLDSSLESPVKSPDRKKGRLLCPHKESSKDNAMPDEDQCGENARNIESIHIETLRKSTCSAGNDAVKEKLPGQRFREANEKHLGPPVNQFHHGVESYEQKSETLGTSSNMDLADTSLVDWQAYEKNVNSVLTQVTPLVIPSSQETLKVLVETRAMNAAPKVVSLLRVKFHAVPSVVSMTGVDYALSTRAGAIRKLWSDFCNGSQKQRIVSQLWDLCFLFDRPILIVEQDKGKFGDKPAGRLRSKYVDMTLAALTQTHIRVLHSESQEETSELLHAICEWERKSGHGLKYSLELTPQQKQWLAWYLSLPRVSYPTALTFLDKFSSISHFINW
ncbi:unnamed protein product [Darwinula stevensoni]|uniref:Fanconi anemia group M protein n=1 Tax=Darwinula stevensoni TaxID=69355 RepID=A0A7R8ZYM3_9CRUS|nr:unnamed protein product [Darwinula stevensoni]CAG0880831.1 unnamed protein product [Darwinula stevensoni]